MQLAFTSRFRQGCYCVLGCFFALFFGARLFCQVPFQVGLSVHLSTVPPDFAKEFNTIQSAGVNSLRDEALWSIVEREPGKLAIPKDLDAFVDRALSLHLQVLLLLTYGNRFYDSGDKPRSKSALQAYARYGVFVVQHFKGRVHEYEMWNEWNGMVGGTSRGGARDYVHFLQVVYPKLKAADPSATFIGCATGYVPMDWLTKVFDAGGLKYMDAVSVHPYDFDQADRTAEGWARTMYSVERLLRHYSGGSDVPLYVTEMGWPTMVGPNSSSLVEQATDLSQLYLLARTMPFIKGVWWYDLRDDGWNASNKEDNFGVVKADLKPKPVLSALTAVTKIVIGASKVEDISPPNASYHAVRFTYPGSTHEILAVWLKGDNNSRDTMSAIDIVAKGPLVVKPNWAATANAKNGAKDSVVFFSGRAHLNLTSMPQILQGTDLSLAVR